MTVLVFMAAAQTSLYAQTETVLYSFTGASGDGIGPAGSLIMDAKGNLYGTTQFGGTSTNCPNGCGTVFKLSSSGTETILHSFTGPVAGDGANPVSGLVMDSSGNLYGTTANGGTSANCPAGGNSPGGCGTVFKLDTSSNETILHNFAGGSSDGAHPTYGSLIIDSSESLYGVTSSGGSSVTTCLFGSSCGIVFKIDSAGNETILHTFTNSEADGGNPSGSLLMDSAGNLYGTTQAGGGALGGGTIYKLDTSHTETVLFTFTIVSPSPNTPFAGLIMDSKGDLFGTTMDGGGSANDGTVFELSASGKLTYSAPLVMSTTNGGLPFDGLVMDKKGNVYGTASQGSTSTCTTFTGGLLGCGIVFKVDKSGNETVLHGFAGTDGANPFGGLIMDRKGDLYGTTTQGGSSVGSAACPTGCGTVFKVNP